MVNQCSTHLFKCTIPSSSSCDIWVRVSLEGVLLGVKKLLTKFIHETAFHVFLAKWIWALLTNLVCVAEGFCKVFCLLFWYSIWIKSILNITSTVLVLKHINFFKFYQFILIQLIQKLNKLTKCPALRKDW